MWDLRKDGQTHLWETYSIIKSSMHPKHENASIIWTLIDLLSSKLKFYARSLRIHFKEAVPALAPAPQRHKRGQRGCWRSWWSRALCTISSLECWRRGMCRSSGSEPSQRTRLISCWYEFLHKSSQAFILPSSAPFHFSWIFAYWSRKDSSALVNNFPDSGLKASLFLYVPLKAPANG